MQTKKCSYCKEVLPVINFSVSCKEKSGYRCRCKECERQNYIDKHNKEDEELIPLPGEEWRDVVGHEERYMVSSFGRVFIKKYPIRRTRYGKEFVVYSTPGLRKLGLSKHIEDVYYTICLSTGSNPVSAKVHRLVAFAFIPNPQNLPWINHKDANKLNNHVDNLEWCTPLQNSQHAVGLGLMNPKKGSDVYGSKLTERQVLEIRAIGKTKTIKEIAAIYNVHFGSISKVLNRLTWDHV